MDKKNWKTVKKKCCCGIFCENVHQYFSATVFIYVNKLCGMSPEKSIIKADESIREDLADNFFLFLSFFGKCMKNVIQFTSILKSPLFIHSVLSAAATQQIRDIDPMLVQCWPTVVNLLICWKKTYLAKCKNFITFSGNNLQI